MIERRSVLLSVSVAAILVAATILAAIPNTPLVSAQQVQGANWEAVNGKNYNFGTSNYSPQNQITKDNIQFLELKWVYPMPTTPTPAQLGGYAPRGGTLCAPLTVDGIVYQCTDLGTVFAIDAATGRTVWRSDIILNSTRDRLAGNSIADFRIHMHGMTYSNGKLYVTVPACRVDVIDALTGKLVRNIPPTFDGCANIPGNKPPTSERGYKGSQAYGPVVIESAKIMVSPMGAVNENNNGARGFFAANNIDTGQLLWRFFLVPPAGGDPEWALRECDKGWMQGVRCRDIPRQYLLNDWGEAGAKGSQAGPGWGQYAVDEETGIIYLATAQPAPDWNATYRPGPNLYTSSVVALRYRTGELVWYHQSSTHDLWDWDCAWNTVLGRIGTKKVVYKACKNGFLYAFDAATGELAWYFNPPAIKRSEFSPWHAESKINLGPKDNSVIGNWDPRNPEVYKRPWQEWPSTGPRWQNPPGTGGAETDVTLANGKVFYGVYNSWSYGRTGPVEPNRPSAGGNVGLPAPETRPQNTTIYALDAASGKALWSYFIDGAAFRAGVTVTGGMAFIPASDGVLRILDEDTGKLMVQKQIGVALQVPPTFGADAKGRMMMLQPFGGGNVALFAGGVTGFPGALLAFGLPDKLPQPQVITKEVVKEVPKEVIKEVPKEVVKEVVKEVTKEVPKEVIKEVPKEVTKTVTVETISPISYAAIGVGIVFVVIGAVMMSRRKKA